MRQYMKLFWYHFLFIGLGTAVVFSVILSIGIVVTVAAPFKMIGLMGLMGVFFLGKTIAGIVFHLDEKITNLSIDIHMKRS